MNLDTLRRALRPLAIRLSNVVRRGVIKRVDDSKKLQEVQASLLDGEVREEVERFQQYGFTSVPVPGAEGIFIAVGGRGDQTYCIGTGDRRFRLTDLLEGEVALYSKHGQTIILKTNGDIELTPKPGQKVAIASDVEITGSLSATGDVAATGDVTAGAISLSTHTHGAGTFTSSPTGGPITGASGGPS